MRTFLLWLLNRLLEKYDPVWCGGCSDLACNDCATEWGRVQVTVEELAKDMYVRNVSSYCEPGLVELMWVTVPEVREFWINEATEVYTLMGLV